MRIIWSPPQGERREFDFHPLEVLWHEREAVEDLGTWATWEQFGMAFMGGSSRAWRAGLWLMLRREQPRLMFDDVQLGRGDELVVVYDDDEQAAIRQQIEDDDTLSEPVRRQMLEQLGLQPEVLAPVTAAPDVPEGSPGKGGAAPRRSRAARSG